MQKNLMAKLEEAIQDDFEGLCFLNLVDFDSKYGHRRDPQGYGNALERFDSQLPDILKKLKDDDLLIMIQFIMVQITQGRLYHFLFITRVITEKDRKST